MGRGLRRLSRHLVAPATPPRLRARRRRRADTPARKGASRNLTAFQLFSARLASIDSMDILGLGRSWFTSDPLVHPCSRSVSWYAQLVPLRGASRGSDLQRMGERRGGRSSEAGGKITVRTRKLECKPSPQGTRAPPNSRGSAHCPWRSSLGCRSLPARRPFRPPTTTTTNGTDPTCRVNACSSLAKTARSSPTAAAAAPAAGPAPGRATTASTTPASAPARRTTSARAGRPASTGAAPTSARRQTVRRDDLQQRHLHRERRSVLQLQLQRRANERCVNNYCQARRRTQPRPATSTRSASPVRAAARASARTSTKPDLPLELDCPYTRAAPTATAARQAPTAATARAAHYDCRSGDRCQYGQCYSSYNSGGYGNVRARCVSTSRILDPAAVRKRQLRRRRPSTTTRSTAAAPRGVLHLRDRRDARVRRQRDAQHQLLAVRPRRRQARSLQLSESGPRTDSLSRAPRRSSISMARRALRAPWCIRHPVRDRFPSRWGARSRCVSG